MALARTTFNHRPQDPAAKQPVGWFDPFIAEQEYTAILDGLDAAAHDLHERLGDYTQQGIKATWERMSAPYAARYEALKATVEAARAGLELVESKAFIKAVPEQVTSDATTAASTGDELRYQRLAARLNGNAANDYYAAARILGDHTGTSFARLWVDEMEARGVFATGAEKDHTALDALKIGSDEFKAVATFVTYGRTVLTGAINGGLKAVESALGMGERLAPRTVETASSVTTFSPDLNRLTTRRLVSVGDVVTAPFRWKFDGTAVSHAEEMNAHRAAEAVKAEILGAEMAESARKSEWEAKGPLETVKSDSDMTAG